MGVHNLQYYDELCLAHNNNHMPTMVLIVGISTIINNNHINIKNRLNNPNYIS